MGGMVNYGSGVNFGTCVNHSTSDMSSSNTAGTFESLNWSNSTSSITGVYCVADYSNTSGGTVTVYFRPGLKSSASTAGIRWYSAGGGTPNGVIRKWYELINI